MSTASAYLTVAGLGIDVVYKDIKNLHISVYPPVGRVRVAAPHRIGEDAIRLAIVQRLPWIKKQRVQLQNADRQTERHMVSGETHYVWGERLRLDASRNGRSRVSVAGKTLWLTTPRDHSGDQCKAVLDRWYRNELKAAVRPLLEKWQPLVGVKASKFVVRKMKTKWGTCQTASRTIWLNPELAKKNPRCLEYIVVHELVHLIERTHNDQFIELMDKHVPDWRARRDELNGAPLASEEWDVEGTA
ncbi:M48 family metallopeptidase [Pseudoclavibacter sp. RFBA6]|uniref:M48 family metallopeptidase n=1 Tax=Pseudoclavibacter sp. RFBA6 TaxID=2080573 RepID=UPI000CE78C57|nr:SprT family zinc-dependent metalloprotease [Pseudoclavibacter sp. RFBA6]PPG40491.1 metal-dependent hydrolase [Pseudoclavibacter sp. RFBA6]